MGRSIDISVVAGAALMLAVLMSSSSSCLARDHLVGGNGSWVEHSTVNYTTWAGKNRFQVHDRLVFNYKPGNDSVLVVSQNAYDSCNTSDPIKRYDDGNTTYQFSHSGPFFFISGAGGHCASGQKVVIVVLAVRSPPAAPSPFPSPTPGGPSPPSSSSSSPALAASKLSLGVLMAAILLAFGRPSLLG